MDDWDERDVPSQNDMEEACFGTRDTGSDSVSEQLPEGEEPLLEVVPGGHSARNPWGCFRGSGKYPGRGTEGIPGGTKCGQAVQALQTHVT
eukprot:1078115-Amphidinium_carterae.1